ncbi:MAG TPA: hypothetical protein VHZ77_06245 [Gaiellaceae bacterium]|nr:hypothetical protein [Gaiellaceae bacterium]
MRRRRGGIWILGLLPATLVSAAVGVHASSAASARTNTRASTIDATYSCRVGSQHVVNLSGTVTLPPVKNQPQPGLLVLTTGAKTVTKGGTTTTVSQVGLSAKKNSLRIDKSSCRRVKHQIPLKPKGLVGPITVTPRLFGHVSEACGPTTARVLVRLRLQITAGAPTHALLAVRNDNAKNRPIAFYNWSPRKVSGYTGKSCVSTS